MTQSEIGKITEETNDVFVPIDGFGDYNIELVLKAAEELAEYFGEFLM